MEYDLMNRQILCREKDGEENHTAYVLDKWGRIVEIQTADGSKECYAYDHAGNMTMSVDGEGNKTRYMYNSINQLAEMIDPMGEKEMYSYDEMNRLCTKIDRNGTVSTYTYNLYGNLLERRAGREGEAAELTEVYHYTTEGLLRAGIAGGMRYGYTYDVMDRLIAKCASGRQLLTMSYDRNGNVKA